MTDPFWEYRVSSEECGRILHRAGLPSAASVTRFPRGEVNAVFEVALTDGRRVILKVQVRPGRPAVHLLWEREACQVLRRESRVPVPEVLAVDTSRQLLPYNYSLLTYLDGTDASDLFPTLAPDGQGRLFRALGRTLAEIHAVPLAAAGRCALPLNRTPEQWEEMQQCAFQEAVTRHAKHGFLPSWLLREAEAFWEETTPRRDSDLCLLHGDFQPSNVKVSPPHCIAGVCDFDQTDIGAPEFDVAAVEMWLAQDRDDLRQCVYEGYAEALAVGADFRDRVRRCAVLRHLQLILAYQGPARLPHGGGSSAEAVALLVAGGGARPAE